VIRASRKGSVGQSSRQIWNLWATGWPPIRIGQYQISGRILPAESAHDSLGPARLRHELIETEELHDEEEPEGNGYQKSIPAGNQDGLVHVWPSQRTNLSNPVWA
jgi:hypothetical protein